MPIAGFMPIDILRYVPYFTKRPKIYFRDSGLFHSLMNLHSIEQVTAHPKLGASWEGFAVDCVCRSVNKKDEEFYFFAAHAGFELDLFWQDGGRNWGAEFKYSDAPRLTRAMKDMVSDLNLSHLWVIYPGDKFYQLQDNISVVPLTHVKSSWAYSG